MSDAPRLWMVAGPNGSGKSSLYDLTDIEGFGRSVWIINPDVLSARIAHQEHVPLREANGKALDRIWAWLQASILAHQTVDVETVLSTGKYRALVERAKALCGANPRPPMLSRLADTSLAVPPSPATCQVLGNST